MDIRTLVGSRQSSVARMLVGTLSLHLVLAGALQAQRAAPPSVSYDQHVDAGGAAPPAETLENPLKGDEKAAEDGGKLFSAFNCDGCHGGGAVGAEGPSLVDGRWRYGGADGEIYHSIFYGRPRGMPAWGGTLPPDAIWRLVSYLKSQQAARDTLSTTRW
jgi:cytochrome c oxidase cbb3-type subunit 3